MFIERFNRVHLRRLLTVVGVFLLSITLTACGGGNRMPSGTIGNLGRYASINNNLEITHLDLWNELRFSSIDVLNDVIDEFILEEQMQRIRTVLDSPEATRSEQRTEEYEEFRDLLDDFALQGIFDTDERGFARLTPRERINRAEIFIANQEINNHEHILAMEENIDNVIHVSDIIPFENSREVNELRLEFVHHFFYRDLARRLFALSELEAEIEEHNRTEDDAFHSESDILNHFRENFEHTGDVTAVIIPFVSNAEAINTLRSFGIKVHNGQWFYIPRYDEYESFLEYIRRFDDITINLNDIDDSFVPLAAIGVQAVLQIFIEIYNFIYGFRPVLESGLYITPEQRNSLGSDRRELTRRIIGLHTNNRLNPNDAHADIDDLRGDFTEFEREELEDLGSISFRNFIYRDLTSLYKAMSEDSPTEVFEVFNATPQSFGTNNHFLIFKLDVEEDLFLEDFPVDVYGEVLIESEDTGNDIVNPEHPLHDVIIRELNNLHVTSAFINTTMADARNEISVRIFDNILEIAFSLQNPDQSRTLGRAPNNYTMAIISFRGERHYLTVYDVFERLEVTIGASTAVDLLTREYMKTTNHFQNGFTQADTDDFLRTLNITLARFSNNEFASQGFPASMGAHNFMLMQFRTARIDDIIHNFFKVNATMTHYINNFLSLDRNDADGLISMFQEFTNLAMENFLSFSGLSLFIHLDDNEDGLADQLEDHPRSGEFTDLALDLSNVVRNMLDNIPVSQHPDELRRIVTEFNNTQRHAAYGSATAEHPNFDPSQPELIWARFRFLGIRLEIVEFNSITNTSDSTEIPSQLLNRAAHLFENEERLVSNEHISVPFIDDENHLTEDGLHLFVITEGQLAPDFTFNEDNDLFELLQNIPIIIHGERYILRDLSDDNGNISHNQILLFIFQSLQLSGTGVSIVPSDILPAMNQFFAPVFNRFNSQTTQRELLIFFVEQQEGNIISFFNDNVSSTVRDERFDRIRATGKLLEDNFNRADDMSNNFFGWWDALDRVIRNGGNQ